MIFRKEEPSGVLELLERIIQASLPLEPLIQKYRSEVEGLAVGNRSSHVTLRVTDVDRAIRRYLAGQLSARDLTVWAGLLEGNELVDYEEPNGLIADVLFELSSPEINGEITGQRCEELLARFAELE